MCSIQWEPTLFNHLTRDKPSKGWISDDGSVLSESQIAIWTTASDGMLCPMDNFFNDTDNFFCQENKNCPADIARCP